VTELTLEWARDVAHVLRRRHLGERGSAPSQSVQALIEALVQEPPLPTWIQVVRVWQDDDEQVLRRKSNQRRIQRARELLTRAMAGLNTDQIQGAVQFRFHTRVTNELTTAQMLLDAGFHGSARLMYAHALDLSKKHELTDCGIRALKGLRKIDAANGNRTVLKILDRQITILRRIQDLELEAESLQDHARALLENFARNRSRAVQQFRGIVGRLKQIANHADATAIVHLSSLRAQLWFASTTRDTIGILRIGKQGTEFLDAHPFAESIAYRVEFEGSRMTTMLSTRDLDGATEVWEGIAPRLTEGAANWVQMLQIYFLVCTMTKHFEEARDALYLYETKRRSGGPDWRIRGWQLFRAYILFLIDEDVIDAGPFEGAPRMYAVNLEKQIKALVVDKGVAGPGVFILKILQWLQSRRYTDFVQSVEAMRQHASRYLRDEQLVRTGVFLRMLASIPAAGFDPEKAHQRGRALENDLSKTHRQHVDSAEIIPYELLWEMVMTILERNLPLRKR
jgi:hypothetical protein